MRLETAKAVTTNLRAWEWVVLLLCLALFAGQAVLSSLSKSAAFDEEYHVAAGIAYLRTGDFRMSTSHPPLINALSALPLLWRSDVNLPLDHPSWAESNYFIFSDVFLWQANDNPQEIVVRARLPVIALGTLLAAVLFFWARQMAGPGAGWVALLLVTFDPNLLANARLVTTDLGVTCFLLLAVWRLWGWLQRPSRFNLLLVGLMAGLAMAAKFTGLMVWPIIVAILLLYPGFQVRRLWSLLGMGLVAYATLWAVFRFDVGPVPGTNFPLSIPAPFYPYSLWDTFMVIEEQPKPAFLWGQISARGWWYYFPVALLVKTPLPLLLLAAAGLWGLFRRRAWGQTAVLGVPPLFFLALAMTGRIAIGYRHILPLVPFLIIIAATATRLLPATPRRGRLSTLVPYFLVGGLLAWQIGGTVCLFPHYEAYFNELVGGPDQGDQVLVDSNIDWGQDLPALRALLAEMGIEEVYLSYFGTALPEAYGINYKPIPGFLRALVGPEVDAYNPYTPLPGWYAISVTSLRLGLLYQNWDMYAYFRDKQPLARAGYSINLYRVAYPPEMPVARVLVNDGRSVSDIPAGELGVQPGQRLVVKWARTPQDRITWPPHAPQFGSDIEAVEANFGEAFTLLGYAMASPALRPGETLALTLYWRRETAVVPAPAPATAPPLAAFVHLSGADPAQIVAQYDGWGVALAPLEPGDIITQPVTMQIPATAPAGSYTLRAGLYSPQSGQRLPVVSPGEAADFVSLAPVTILP